MGLPGDSDGKASACNVGDPGSIPGSRRSPEEGYGHPLQYSCLENSKDRGAWWATVQGVSKSWTQLSLFQKVDSKSEGRINTTRAQGHSTGHQSHRGSWSRGSSVNALMNDGVPGRLKD